MKDTQQVMPRKHVLDKQQKHDSSAVKMKRVSQAFILTSQDIDQVVGIIALSSHSESLAQSETEQRSIWHACIGSLGSGYVAG